MHKFSDILRLNEEKKSFFPVDCLCKSTLSSMLQYTELQMFFRLNIKLLLVQFSNILSHKL